MTDERTPAERRVDEVLAAQRAKGRAKYCKGLDHAEGRDWNAEAMQELADAVQYLAAEVERAREDERRWRGHAARVEGERNAAEAEVRRLQNSLPRASGPLGFQLSRGVRSLRGMEDGWLDGEGVAPDAETLDWMEQRLPAWLDGMPVPRLYPTEGGLVSAEWDDGDWSVSAEFHACKVGKDAGDAPQEPKP